MAPIAPDKLLADGSATERQLASALESIARPTILVVGDLILDRYVWGSVERVSPEAPVPVLRIEREEVRLGGAGSVIANLVRLGANVIPFGVIGEDAPAGEFRRVLAELGVPDDGIVVERGGRPSTVKTRLLASNQQLLRVDAEVTAAYPREVEDALAAKIEAAAATADLILCSDYDKGLFAGGLLGRIAALGAGGDRPVPVIADPRKHEDYERYRGLWGITPNRRETELATGSSIGSRDDALRVARKLVDDLGLRFSAVTLDMDGILIVLSDGRFRHFPTRPRSVFDVTGAGDMVLSVLGLVLAGGYDLSIAAPLANAAGGLEVERVGVTPLDRSEIVTEVLGHAAPLTSKLRTQEEAAEAAGEVRRRGGQVVFTNGCFDILHVGHLRYLSWARSRGDALVVGLNTDRSVQELKGPDRPYFSELDRAEALAALSAVDHVVLFDEETPIDLIAAVRPDVLIKGEDYRDKVVVGRELVEGWGGIVELAPLTPGRSTSEIAERIAGASRPVS